MQSITEMLKSRARALFLAARFFGANIRGISLVRTLAGLAFVGQYAALDVGFRGHALYLERLRMLGGLFASVALLTLILNEVRTRGLWVRALVSLTLGALTTSTLAYYRYYHAPLDAQTVVAARHAWADVKPMLVRGLPVFAAGSMLVALIEFAVMSAVSAATRGSVSGRWCAIVLALGVAAAGGPNHATAEFRMLGAGVALMRREKPRLNTVRVNLPELSSTRARLPNVLLIITESVRASDSCMIRGCATSPELDRRLPDRITFQHARSIASYTAIALSGILTGQTQIKSRSELEKVPDIFDLAHAARAGDEAYAIHYWSSQMAGVLERAALDTISDVVTAENLLGHPLADIEDAVEVILDRRVGDLCEQRLGKVESPQFIVVHLSGTHAPYAFDENTAPFKPWRRQVTWAGLDELHNAYLNSILEQDRTVGRCIDAYLRATANQPWVLLYTSDHGEAFGEHSAIHHGQNLYDEQIRVPLIVASGKGAMSPTELQTLSTNSMRPVTHLDIVPTLLDLWGLRSHPLLQASSSRLAGRSLLAGASEFTMVPISNCTDLFPCPLNTWGMLDAKRKLTAQSWDGNWRCLSLDGPETERPLADCANLESAACHFFRRLPNGNIARACGIR